MSALLLLAIAIAVVGFVTLGLGRIRISRSPGPEGIEDPQVARAYDRISRMPQFQALRRIIVSRLSERPPSGALPDIGCGPGLLTTQIALRYPSLHVLGIDTTQEMVKAAGSNASALGLWTRLDFREGDIAKLPLPDGLLDYAISTLSLHHWSNPGQALAEVHRVLKPGGRFLLFDLRRDARRLVCFLMGVGQRV